MSIFNPMLKRSDIYWDGHRSKNGKWKDTDPYITARCATTPSLQSFTFSPNRKRSFFVLLLCNFGKKLLSSLIAFLCEMLHFAAHPSIWSPPFSNLTRSSFACGFLTPIVRQRSSLAPTWRWQFFQVTRNHLLAAFSALTAQFLRLPSAPIDLMKPS